jgi:hypothetical protein
MSRQTHAGQDTSLAGFACPNPDCSQRTLESLHGLFRIRASRIPRGHAPDVVDRAV